MRRQCVLARAAGSPLMRLGTREGAELHNRVERAASAEGAGSKNVPKGTCEKRCD